MRPSRIWQIAKKEIVSTLRDRRALVSNLVIPLLLLPVMMLGLPLLMGGLFEREAVTVTDVGVVGIDNVPAALRAALEAQNVALVPVEDATGAVQADDVPVAIVIPPGFEADIASGGDATVSVHAKTGNIRSELNVGKVQQAVTTYQQGIVAERLGRAGLDPSVLQPVTVAMVDASSAGERSSGQLSWLIPFFIAIWTLTGGQMTAIDATAGEKERGTLEVLLVAPVRRSEVVFGKFIATLTFGLTAAIMAIVGYLLGGALMRSVFLPRLGDDAGGMVSIMGGTFDASIGTIGLLLISALLLSSFVAAMLLSISLFARSFKEAQSYIAPLSFLFIIPVLVLQFKDLIGLGDGVYYVPVLNVLVYMDDVVRGAATAEHMAITWVTLIIATLILLAFANRNFTRENVIFRT
ncbi:MAG TPA: ABC transporter permease [Trueperaceae bacterium]|nr:ABC transporter permease [Trueperaceae bacterium]